MEGLQRRFGATKKTNPEDQSEFLDEEGLCIKVIPVLNEN